MHRAREYYEKEYHYDEDLAVIDEKRIARFFRSVRFITGNRVLDIGCGVGWALQYCFQKGLQCVGFDISERAIRLAKSILGDNISALVADGEHLPFASSSFDIVSSLGTIEHFSSPTRGLGEISSISKEGSQILLVVPNSYWLLNKTKFYTGTEQPQEMLATIGQWARLFRRHGLIVQSIGKDIGPRVLKNKHPLGILKRAVLKITIALPVSLAYQFVFVCRKK